MAADEYSAEPPPLGGRALMRQRWSEVSFLHWRVDPALVAPHLPPGCTPELVDGSAWVGLIAFQMSNTAFLGGPRIPWLGDFPEVNVRLYSIDALGRRGVVFLSLEASHLLPVLFARAAFGLKYQWASMAISEEGGARTYRTRRIGRPTARSRITVRPLAPLAGGTGGGDDGIAIALTAQWAFHQEHLGRTLYCRNRHQPWPLHRAELMSLDDHLLRAAGFGALADRAPDSVLYATAVDTEFGVPSRLPRSLARRGR